MNLFGLTITRKKRNEFVYVEYTAAEKTEPAVVEPKKPEKIFSLYRPMTIGDPYLVVIKTSGDEATCKFFEIHSQWPTEDRALEIYRALVEYNA